MPDEANKYCNVQSVRHLMRPFLTIFFSLLFGSIVIISIYIDKSSLKDMLLAVDGILGTVIGYHFGKSSRIDNHDNENGQ